MDNNVLWLDDRTSKTGKMFIERLFNELGEFTSEFIRKTEEMPFYYGERPQVGLLTQAATRCGYFAVQDYNVNIQQKLPKRLKNHYVPDLRIWIPVRGGKPHTCVFEAKVNWTSIDPNQDRLARIISGDSGGLTKANKKISQHGLEEGHFRCALVAIRVYCKSSKWKRWANKPSLYNDKIDGLLDKIKCALDECRKGEDKPNFWWYYFAPHDTIRRMCWKENGKLQVPALGVFWVGSIKPY